MRILFPLLSFFFFIQLHAQQFTAGVEGLGQYYRLSFTVDSRGAEDFTPPSFAEFDVLSGPSESTSSSYQIINGKASHSESTTYTYILSPRREGTFKIGTASVKVKGKTLRSRPVTVDVSAATVKGNSRKSSGNSSSGEQQERLQQAGSRVTDRDLYIDVTPSRTHVFEQEAVLLTYRIHSRIGVGLANTTITRKPDFKGMISQEIPLPGNQIETTPERIGDATYRTGTILQYVVFPQQSGKVTIPAIEFECTVIQQDRFQDPIDMFFNSGGRVGVKVLRKVKDFQLQVDPLPQPRPAGFCGGVGRYKVEAKLLGTKVSTNEPATYRITLEGTGNSKLITAPVVAFPDDFDNYDPKIEDNTRPTGEGMTGVLSFDYTFVPRNLGNYEVPSTEITYFDTQEKEYRTLKTPALKLNVVQGAHSSEEAERQIALLGADIRPHHPSDKVSATGFFPVWGDVSYWLLTLLALLFAAMACVAGRKYARLQSDPAAMRRNSAVRTARRRLKDARSLPASTPITELSSAIEETLRGYVADVAGISPTSLTKERMIGILQERGVETEIVSQFERTLDVCGYARFAPAFEGQKDELLGSAERIVTALSAAGNRI